MLRRASQISLVAAFLAGFVAFAWRMLARESNRLAWLIGGALAMGTGIWSMHFVGMTALSLPVEISYDLGITLLSWLAAVAASALALFIVGYGHVRTSTVALGAISMGAGICLMHYSGMWAMRMSPAISGDKDAAMQTFAGTIKKLEQDLALRGMDALLSTNSAHCPSDGDNAQWLLLRSWPKSGAEEPSAVA